MIIYIAIAVNWKTLPYIHRRRHCCCAKQSTMIFYPACSSSRVSTLFFFASLVMLATRTGHLNFNEWLNDKRRSHSIPQHPCTYTHGSSYVRNHSSSNHNMMNRLIERRLVCEPSGVRCSRFYEWFSAIVIISTLWTAGPHWCGQMATHKLQSYAFSSVIAIDSFLSSSYRSHAMHFSLCLCSSCTDTAQMSVKLEKWCFNF